ncbi:MAG: hypothetical protein Fur0035_04430 [Anaerolineales bacterium]
MKQKISLTILITIFTAFSALVFRAQASPAGQLPQFATPTPGADGRIVYIVEAGQNCLQISLLTGIPVDTLRTLNQLDAACTLTQGQQLILGIGGPASQPTLSGPTITPTPAEPTPTPPPGSAKICMLLYEDINGDALRQDSENAIADGAISISGASGQFSQALATQPGSEPTCVENVPEGSYTLSAAAPQGYFPTSAQSFTLKVDAGETLYVDFGAQKGSAAAPAAPGEGGASPLIGLAGAGLLLAALGLGFYSWRVYGRKPPLQNTPKPPSIIR